MFVSKDYLVPMHYSNKNVDILSAFVAIVCYSGMIGNLVHVHLMGD